jgi:hypothetical protein
MKWSEALTKTKIDQALFDDFELTPTEKPFFVELRNLCSTPIDSLNRVTEIKTAIKELLAGRKLSTNARELVSVLKEELAEIASDLRFAKSRRGRYVLFVQDYVQLLYRTLRQDSRFAEVYVGGHVEREIVMVGGEVRNKADLETLKSIISAHPSGLPVEYKVTVTENA